MVLEPMVFFGNILPVYHIGVHYSPKHKLTCNGNRIRLTSLTPLLQPKWLNTNKGVSTTRFPFPTTKTWNPETRYQTLKKHAPPSWEFSLFPHFSLSLFSSGKETTTLHLAGSKHKSRNSKERRKKIREKGVGKEWITKIHDLTNPRPVSPFAPPGSQAHIFAFFLSKKHIAQFQFNKCRASLQTNLDLLGFRLWGNHHNDKYFFSPCLPDSY